MLECNFAKSCVQQTNVHSMFSCWFDCSLQRRIKWLKSRIPLKNPSLTQSLSQRNLDWFEFVNLYVVFVNPVLNSLIDTFVYKGNLVFKFDNHRTSKMSIQYRCQSVCVYSLIEFDIFHNRVDYISNPILSWNRKIHQSSINGTGYELNSK